MAESRARLLLLAPLLVLLLGTRAGHFGALPDASWAVFFLAGFYLRGAQALSFPLLMAAAVLADWWAIRAQGLDFFAHYCVSPAYAFLVPAYGSLSVAGAWLGRRAAGDPRRALRLLPLALPAGVGVCFLISNGSFYWLSGRVPAATLPGWLENLAQWFPPYLATAAAYVALAAIVHALALPLRARLPAALRATRS
ncbi:MAG: hypothetical protein RML12_09805 [Xanthomonadales bacterium]|nr:hypothetical protein [Xanthomonadales bacterium]